MLLQPHIVTRMRSVLSLKPFTDVRTARRPKRFPSSTSGTLSYPISDSMFMPERRLLESTQDFPGIGTRIHRLFSSFR